MMIHHDCLRRFHNCLDKYHLLTKEWKNTVEGKVNGDEAKEILSILKKRYLIYLIILRLRSGTQPCCEEL